MITAARLGSTILATLALALGYAREARWEEWALIAGAGVLWLIGQQMTWRWMPAIGFAFFVSMAARGAWLHLQAALMLVAVVAAMTAWDLSEFQLRLPPTRPVGSTLDLERQHLWRLVLVDALGLALAALALEVRIDLGLGSALLLGVLVVVGLSQAVRFLRRQSD